MFSTKTESFKLSSILQHQPGSLLLVILVRRVKTHGQQGQLHSETVKCILEPRVGEKSSSEASSGIIVILQQYSFVYYKVSFTFIRVCNNQKQLALSQMTYILNALKINSLVQGVLSLQF